MRGLKSALVTFSVPILLLAGGAGVGLVIASEAPTDTPSGKRAFASAPASLLAAPGGGDSASRGAKEARAKPASLKRKCRKRKGAAKRRCLRKAKKLLRAKPKTMPIRKARSIARDRAERVYFNDAGGYAWDDFGVVNCKRLGRSTVTCAVWVRFEDDNYSGSDYGATYVCEWLVRSSYKKGGRLKVANGFNGRDCYYE